MVEKRGNAEMLEGCGRAGDRQAQGKTKSAGGVLVVAEGERQRFLFPTFLIRKP